MGILYREDDDLVISVIYSFAFLFALLIFGLYAFLFKSCEKLFLLLFGSIVVINLGYLLVSLSSSIGFALFANTLAYFGSAFLPMLMLLILLESLERKVPKSVVIGLVFFALCIFLLTATQMIPGVDLYYKDVRLLFTEDGAAILDKEYGPCHILYTVYLLGYFAVMIYYSFDAIRKKKMESGKQTTVLLIAVFVNLCVWLAEQFTVFELEFLAISYLISEIFLLIFRQLILENQGLRESLAFESQKAANAEVIPEDRLSAFKKNLNTLTPTEKIVLGHYIGGKSTAETLEAMGITQNTLKYHNKNLYSKLFVSSKKELLELYRKANENKKS
ncbi:MAG: hypothetical protein IJC26_02600 [Clostridia bacterium]|nr:hypothetical protein [Clostridia bacterium]